jgi:hypothetical protein
VGWLRTTRFVSRSRIIPTPVFRKDVLAFTNECCKANGGTAGVDNQRFEQFLRQFVQPTLYSKSLRYKLVAAGLWADWFSVTARSAGSREIELSPAEEESHRSGFPATVDTYCPRFLTDCRENSQLLDCRHSGQIPVFRFLDNVSG